MFFITNNKDKSPRELAKNFKGVGIRTIEKILSEIPEDETDQSESLKKVTVEYELPVIEEGQTMEERKQKLANLQLQSGQMLGHDEGTVNQYGGHDRATVMTSASSELADANKLVLQKIAAENRREKLNGMIHRPLGKKRGNNNTRVSNGR